MSFEAWAYTFVNGILLLIVGFLVKLVVDHLKKLVKEVGVFKNEVQRYEQELRGTKSEFEGLVSKTYSLESRLWHELNKLRRTVVSGNLLIRRRKRETHQILQEQREAKSRLDLYEKFSKSASKLLVEHNKQIKITRTDVVRLGKELRIYKNGSEE